jgi:hypothetical protein
MNREYLVKEALDLHARISHIPFRAHAQALILAGLGKKLDKKKLFAELKRELDAIGPHEQDANYQSEQDQSIQNAAEILYKSGEVDSAVTLLKRAEEISPAIIYFLNPSAVDPFFIEVRKRIQEPPDCVGTIIAYEALAFIHNDQKKKAQTACAKIMKLLPAIKGAPYDRGRLLAFAGRIQAATGDSPVAIKTFRQAVSEAGRSAYAGNNDPALKCVVEQIVDSKLSSKEKKVLFDRARAVVSKKVLKESSRVTAFGYLHLGEIAEAVSAAKMLEPSDAADLANDFTKANQQEAANDLLTWAIDKVLDSPMLVGEHMAKVAAAQSNIAHDDRGVKLLEKSLDIEIESLQSNPNGLTDGLKSIVRIIRQASFTKKNLQRAYDRVAASTPIIGDAPTRCNTFAELLCAYTAIEAAKKAKLSLKDAKRDWDPAIEARGGMFSVLGLLERVVEAASY